MVETPHSAVQFLRTPTSLVHPTSPPPPRSRAAAAEFHLQFGSLPATPLDSRDLVLRAIGDRPMADTPAAGSLKPMAMTDQEREDLVNETTFNIGVFHNESISLMQANQARNAKLRAQLLENDAEIAAAQAQLAANATRQATLMADLAAKLGKNPAPSPAPPHVPIKFAPAPHATAAELHAIKHEQRSMDLARQQREQREQAQLEHEQREHEQEFRDFDQRKQEEREQEQREREEREQAQQQRELHLQRQREIERRATKTRQKQATLRNMHATLARCQADIDAFNASSSGDENPAADPPSFSRDRRAVGLSAAEMAHNAKLDLRTAGFNNRSEEQIHGEKRRNRASQLDTQDAFFTKRRKR